MTVIIDEFNDENDHKEMSCVSSMNERKGYMAASIYIQDQVAAVLANMAANEETRNDVVEHSGRKKRKIPNIFHLFKSKKRILNNGMNMIDIYVSLSTCFGLTNGMTP